MRPHRRAPVDPWDPPCRSKAPHGEPSTVAHCVVVIGWARDEDYAMPKMTQPSRHAGEEGYAPLPAVDPQGGGTSQVFVSLDRMNAVAMRGPGHVRELAFCVPYVLSHPTAVFRGVGAEDDRESLCYCGTPPRAYEGPTGRKRTPPANQVFLVLVNGKRVVYAWRWEPADPREKGLPLASATRYVEREL